MLRAGFEDDAGGAEIGRFGGAVHRVGAGAGFGTVELQIGFAVLDPGHDHLRRIDSFADA